MIFDFILIVLIVLLGVVHTYYTVIYVEDIVMILLSDANLFLYIDIVGLLVWSVWVTTIKFNTDLNMRKQNSKPRQILNQQKMVFKTSPR